MVSEARFLPSGTIPICKKSKKSPARISSTGPWCPISSSKSASSSRGDSNPSQPGSPPMWESETKTTRVSLLSSGIYKLNEQKMGDDLLSHEVSLAVPSALAGLTSLFGMGRGVSPPPSSPFLKRRIFGCKNPRGAPLIFGNCIALLKPLSPRLISTTRLNTSLHLHLWPINLVVYQESYPLKGVGGLISRRASRLDAFSGYPFRTWLPGGALGRTTGTPEVRPLRSSRTRSRSSQASNAHGR